MAGKKLKKTAHNWAWRAETRLDRLVRLINDRVNPIKKVRVQVFLGYGNAEKITVLARLQQDKGIESAEEQDSTLDNIKAASKQILTREIPNVRMQAEFAGQTTQAISDEEGYVEFKFSGSALMAPNDSWHKVQLESLEPVAGSEEIVRAETEVLIPCEKARLAVISDIDDTVIHTGATSTLQKSLVTLLQNAHSRVPFEGASAFDQALQKGTTGGEQNPVFYLSSSPWNLYDLLKQFLDIHQFPQGPLMLRDLGLEETHIFKSSHLKHKLGHVHKLLGSYPSLPFILIGDSGQKDAEIYQEVAQAYPDRILAIYIRNVTDARRETEVMEIARQVNALGPEMVLVQDSEEAARHAADKGWIAASAKPAISEQKQEDQEEDF